MANIEDPIPGDLGPFRASARIDNGHVVLSFDKEIAWLAMTPSQAQSIGESLVKMAGKLESGEYNKPADLTKVANAAQELFGAAGSHISGKSIVGIADTNEVLGLCVQVLTDTTRAFVDHSAHRTNKKKPKGDDHEQ